MKGTLEEKEQGRELRSCSHSGGARWGPGQPREDRAPRHDAQLHHTPQTSPGRGPERCPLGLVIMQSFPEGRRFSEGRWGLEVAVWGSFGIVGVGGWWWGARVCTLEGGSSASTVEQNSGGERVPFSTHKSPSW